MATTIPESSAQYERDLRSANADFKRSKDASAKWSYGATTPTSWWTPPSLDGEEIESFKARPIGKWSDHASQFKKDQGNFTKLARTTGRMRDVPNKRFHSKVSAQEEINDAARSVLDYLPSPHRQNSAMDNVLYSFDRTDSPGRPLTLDIFVKTTGRDTEKLVEKEYEILDGNGHALKGRKARRDLRRGTTTGSKAANAEVEVDEDDFELV